MLSFRYSKPLIQQITVMINVLTNYCDGELKSKNHDRSKKSTRKFCDQRIKLEHFAADNDRKGDYLNAETLQ